MVLSTHLFNKPAFQNVIVNGLVLAADGKKMSKRLRNYPDPQTIVEAHGADAVRMYMCNSQVVRAEPLRFKEEGVRDVVKDVFLPWYNAYRFLVQETFRYEGNQGQKFTPDVKRVKASSNIMDKWINACNHGLIKFVREEMAAYRLYTVVARLVTLLEELTNWYVRLNRDRMRGNSGPEEALTSLCTLYDVLLNVTVCLAPVTPFITELIYQNLSRALPEGHPMKAKSVHFVMIPEPDLEALNPDIMTAMSSMQTVVELGRTCRERRKVGLKTPLRSMTIMNKNETFNRDMKNLQTYIEEELNVMEVVFKSDTAKVGLSATLNFKVLGRKLGKDMKAVQDAVKELSQDALTTLETEGSITVLGHSISLEAGEISVSREVKDVADPNLDVIGDAETLLVLDFTYDEDLSQMALARDIVNRVQRLRKESKLQQDDPVDMWAEVKSGANGTGALTKCLAGKKDYVEKLLRRQLWSGALRQGHEVLVKREEFDLDGNDGDKLLVTITLRAPFFNDAAIKKLTGGDSSAAEACRQYMQTYDLSKLTKITSQKVLFGGKSYQLNLNEHFSIGPAEASWLKGK